MRLLAMVRAFASRRMQLQQGTRFLAVPCVCWQGHTLAAMHAYAAAHARVQLARMQQCMRLEGECMQQAAGRAKLDGWLPLAFAPCGKASSS